MKKTLIALMALAGVATAQDYTLMVLADTTPAPIADYDITAGGDLYAGEFTLTFTIGEDNTVTGDYDIIAAYYQVNGSSYNVNAFQLNSNGTLTLNRGGALSSTTLTNEVTTGTQDKSTFTANGAAYTLSAGTYTIKYLGGTNDSAAADLYLDGVKVAGFTGGKHNMNGAQSGGLALNLVTNDSYSAVMVPEPTTATLSLLALAGLAARRRRR